MSTTTTPLVIQLIAPVAVASMALFPLSASGGALDTMVTSFFGYSVLEQLSLLALVFSVIFTAVTLSHAVDSSSSNNKTTTTANEKDETSETSVATTKYPLEEMKACENIKDKFKCIFPLLREEILVHMKEHNEMTDEAVDWVKDMMDYNVPGGKLNRGTTVVSVHRTLVGRSLTELEIARASVLGWAIEFLQAFFLVADDVMDESQTRRGQPCWYKKQDVQLIAINDSFLLESFVFTILKNHFGHEPYYHRLIELFMEVVQKTEFGQLLDLTSQPMGSKGTDLNRFTLERYRMIVKYKTARSICCIMGEYFQIQDDYLDCFGSPEVIGKVGTDIQDNKCSWLVVQALLKATPSQRRTLEQNYGKWDDKKVEKVKKVYREMKLPKAFETYEEESYQQIQAELDKVTLMPRDVFELLLKKIYKRSK